MIRKLTIMITVPTIIIIVLTGSLLDRFAAIGAATIPPKIKPKNNMRTVIIEFMDSDCVIWYRKNPRKMKRTIPKDQRMILNLLRFIDFNLIIE